MNDRKAFNAAESTFLGTCITTFKATVPRALFYQMTIGTHGAPTYSFDEMQKLGWKVTLSLN